MSAFPFMELVELITVSMFFKDVGLQKLSKVLFLDGGLMCFFQSGFTGVITDFWGSVKLDFLR